MIAFEEYVKLMLRICYFPKLRNPRQVMSTLDLQCLILIFKIIIHIPFILGKLFLCKNLSLLRIYKHNIPF